MLHVYDKLVFAIRILRCFICADLLTHRSFEKFIF